MKKKIALFASGNGTNAENIIRYFQKSETIEVVVVLSNKKDAGVLERAGKLNIPCRYFSKEDLYENDAVLNLLVELKIDLIVLAGFLKLIPVKIIVHFPDKIINIHPALLPKFGGKDFYGNKVHEAVRDSGEKETGITIHYVNARFDEGEIIFQKKIAVDENDTTDTIAQKVHQLEYRYFPEVIEKLLTGK